MNVERLSAVQSGILHPSGIIPGTHICWSLSRTHELRAARKIMSMKFAVTKLRFEPATFRLVAQCLNQLRHFMPCQKK